jgi:phage terminase small subunit
VPRPKLTAKQRAFIRHYQVLRNAKAAALKAGYSEKTAAKIGSENLAKPEIKKAIDAAEQRAIKRNDITIDRVLQEWARIAFVDPLEITAIDAKGRTVLKPTNEWTEDQARAVASIETKAGGGLKVTLNSKVKALAALTSLLKPDVDEPDVESIDLRITLKREGDETNDGTE